VVGGIFCDLEKAFGSVNYDILLCKLNFYRIRGPFHKLIKSYVTNRYWRFLIGSKSCYHSSYLEWGKIIVFQPQKRIIRIVTESRPRGSCRQSLKKLGILPLLSQYIFSLLLVIVNNKASFQMNSEIHSINLSSTTRRFDNVQNGTYYTSIKVFGYLPTHIKNLSHNHNHFRLALRDLHHFHSFYTLEEYFNSSSNLWT